ncbi:MAG TPA: glutamine-hydrolyzing GMP synthase [Candidatus Cloacimonas sp.]|nr:glutamine-hydrolyzing GMP synthase [Candidatus Cloacimonas sp.]HPV63988.1 glutamine-hydrolyzing GMP synthase [Candidatus Cloacimonas sp.]
MHNKVLILDFGSQYTQLIARKIRSLNIYCEIHPFTISADKLYSFAPKAIILSGSPYSINNNETPKPDECIWQLGIPILGICYGMQLMVAHFGGKVQPSAKREYGLAYIKIIDHNELLADLGNREEVWMSHSDAISNLPECFSVLAETENSPYAAIAHNELPFYALQFHPEVVHTKNGIKILENFLYRIVNLTPDWTAGTFINKSIEKIRSQVGDKKVILGLSGGVDSTVTAALLYRAIGKQLLPIFVDTGLMRYREADRVKETFSAYPDLNIRFVDAGETFLNKLKGITDPETKRKIIGGTFIEVFDKVASEFEDVHFLAQGTLYPDVIESASLTGPSATIKSHHNVGGLPDNMLLVLIEPLRELFKDEVREVGTLLGLPESIVQRHPFPGPGLAVRILGEVDAQKVNILQLADEIFISELQENGLYNKTWQAFVVLLPVRTVGVMGDERSYEQVCALRAVDSVDGMTATFSQLPFHFLQKVANRICNEVKGISRVVYDLSSKPPATIEWE